MIKHPLYQINNISLGKAFREQFPHIYTKLLTLNGCKINLKHYRSSNCFNKGRT